MTKSLRNAGVGEVLGKASLLAIFGVFATFKTMAVSSRLMSWEPSQGIENHIELAAQVAALVFVILLLSLTLLRLSPRRRPRDPGLGSPLCSGRFSRFRS